MDRSESFLNRARANLTASEEYVAADVAAAPLRIGNIDERPDLIYARFLASHLSKPEQAISSWVRELRAGGLLLVEEYLNIVSEMLAYHGNELFVGQRLTAAHWEDGAHVETNRTVEVRPGTRQAARMFSMNLPNWCYDPYVEATYPADEVERLAAELDKLTDSVERGWSV